MHAIPKINMLVYIQRVWLHGSGKTLIRIMKFCVAPLSAQERSGVSIEGIDR